MTTPASAPPRPRPSDGARKGARSRSPRRTEPATTSTTSSRRVGRPAMHDAGFALGDVAGVVITVELGQARKAADAGMAALIRAGEHIYQRGRMLVRPARIQARSLSGKKIELPGILTVTQPYLQRALAR